MYGRVSRQPILPNLHNYIYEERQAQRNHEKSNAGRVRQNLMAHLACTGKPLDLRGKKSSCSLLGNRVVQHQANILLQYF